MKASIKKLIALTLCLSLALPILVACTDDVPDDVVTDTSGDTSADSSTAPPETDPPETDIIVEENLPDPVIMSFDGSEESLADFYVHGDGKLQGAYEFVDEDGSKVLSLNYSPYPKWSSYRVMPRFNKAGVVSEEHKYMVIVYKTDDLAVSNVSAYNNGEGKTVSIIENTAVSSGEWTASAPVDITEGNILQRFIDGKHISLMYNASSDISEFYIKEIGFFASENQARAYYGDLMKIKQAPVKYAVMNFGANSNSSFTSGENYGEYSVNDAEGTLDIVYAKTTNIGPNYIAKIKFSSAGQVSANQKYVRVLYAAENPEHTTMCMMHIQNDKTAAKFYVVPKVKDTNGEFVLSNTAMLDDDTMSRLTGTMHVSLAITNTFAGGTYRIKALYFFESKEEADAFELTEAAHKLTIVGNDISKYQIVVSADTAEPVRAAAAALANQIHTLTGVTVPIVTDDAPETEYEIILGRSSRAQSTEAFDALQAKNNQPTRIYAAIEENDLIITSALAVNLKEAVDIYLNSYLYLGQSTAPEKIDITERHSLMDFPTVMTEYGQWSKVQNLDTPERFTDDFDTDDGYFTEESNASDWTIGDGIMSTDTDDYALTYIHVYEKNASLSAKWKYTDAKDGASAGLMLRYTAADAYVKAGYDFDKKQWYIESREGIDFYLERVASADADIKANTWYTLTLTVDADTAVLLVDGKEVARGTVSQLSYGRPAFYADNVSISVDDCELLMMTGQGTIWQNVVHTKLPDDTYFEGGSVHLMNDGTLMYQHHSGITYKSLDDGKTWEPTDPWIKLMGYSNVLRLNNGDFIRITWKDFDDGKQWIYTQTSSDEGKTWVDGGKICYGYYGGNTTASAGNMNDKIFQSATTDRIFYGQNYQVQGNSFFNGRYVFGEVYYSDDNGATWTKSETDSWEIPGNESAAYFGESKLLECADGTIRLYNSWNKYDCIVYSESTDNGVTWGPLQKMEEFICPKSSMQFVRDPFAENDTTYYMVWVYGPIHSSNKDQARSRLCLAKTTDGKNWDYLGDVWRWENNWMAPNTAALISHVVDPFVYVTEDYVICGSGFSEQIRKTSSGDHSYHQAQRQHIYSIRKDTLTAVELPPVQ